MLVRQCAVAMPKHQCSWVRLPAICQRGLLALNLCSASRQICLHVGISGHIESSAKATKPEDRCACLPISPKSAGRQGDIAEVEAGRGRLCRQQVQVRWQGLPGHPPYVHLEHPGGCRLLQSYSVVLAWDRMIV